MMNGFVEAIHLSKRLSNLERNSVIVGKEPTTINSSVDPLDDLFLQTDQPTERIKGKFRPKPCKKVVKCVHASSDNTKSSESEPLFVPETNSHDHLSFSTPIAGTSNSEISDLQKSVSDQFVNLEMLDSDILQTSTSGGTQNSQKMNGFAEASHLSERLPNLEINSVIGGKEPTTVHSSVDPLDDLFLQSDRPAERIKGKFRPKPCKKIVKCVHTSSDNTKTSFECNKALESESSIVPETNSYDHLRFSTPIDGTSNSEISDLQTYVSDQYVNIEMLDSDIIQSSTTGVAGPISTLNLNSTNSEPICVSTQLEGTQSSLMMNEFTKVSHISERLSNLEKNFVKVEKEPTTVHSSVDPLNDLFLQSDQPAERKKGKFRPKPCKKIVECVHASSHNIKTSSLECNKTSESESSFVPGTNSHDHLSFSTQIFETSNSEISELQKTPPDQLVNSEMLDSDIIQISTTGVTGPISTLNLDSINSEPICVSSQLEVTQSSLVMNEFTEASHLSERLSNLERNSVIVGKEPTTVHSNVDPLDDLFLQSDQPAERKKGKFRPKPCKKIVKSVHASSDSINTSSLECNNTESESSFVPGTNSHDHLSFSTPILGTSDSEISELQKSSSDQLVNLEMLDSDIIQISTTGVTGPISTLKLNSTNSEPICVSSQLEGTQSSPVMNKFTDASYLSERISNLERNSVIVGKESTTVNSSVDPLDNLFLQSDQPADSIKTASFRCNKTSDSESPFVLETNSQDHLCFSTPIVGTSNSEISDLQKSSSDQFVNLEMLDSDIIQISTTEASHLSEKLSNSQRNFVIVGKEPITMNSNVDLLDDSFLQSDQPAVKKMIKFRPKSSLRVKDGTIAKSVSFILSNDGGELPVSAECQSEFVTSNTSVAEMASDEVMNESLGSLSMCKRDNQVDLDGFNVLALDTTDILSQPIYNSDLKDRTKSAETISNNCPGLIDFGSSDVDSLHIRSVATCSSPITQTDVVLGNSQLDSLSINSKSLDAHGPGFLADDLMKSLPTEEQGCFLANSSEEMACGGNNNDLNFEEPNLDEHAPSIVQNDEAGKSSKRVGQRKRKFNSSAVVNIISEDQNSKDTISGMDEDYDDDYYNSEDMSEKKNMKATRKSGSRSSENAKSIKSSKKALGKSDSTIKDPPKKRLPHGSRRKNTKRQENKALLEFPDDELGRRQLAIRDLIKLAGFKEQISNKEATLKKNFDNQSEEHEQDSDADNADRYIHREVPKFNYHSHMRRTQKTRWSNTETELFYQALEQFGTDFTMIQILFPNRSREQVKSKFKNEQRKHPLQIADAIVYRSRDHSHFQKVIQHLQSLDDLNPKTDSIDPSVNSQDEAD